MTDLNPYSAPQSISEAPAEAQPRRRVGGALYLLGLWLAGGACVEGKHTYDVYWNYVAEGRFSALTDPSGPYYHPLWAPLIFIIAATGPIFAAGTLAALLMLISRARRFPAFLTWLLVAMMASRIVIWGIEIQIPSFSSLTGRSPLRSPVGTGTLLSIGVIVYLRMSAWVRSTFLQEASAEHARDGATDPTD